MEINYSFIAIEGVIGAGKTTLAKMLSQALGTDILLEEFAENTFLDKFYQNPDVYAFPLEISFLVERFNQVHNKFSSLELFKPIVIADYLFDKSLLFAKNNLKDDHFRLFHQLFTNFSEQLPNPDLIIYLDDTVENLQKKIVKRGRVYEQNIQDNYLADISEAYKTYLKHYNKCPIVFFDISEADFTDDKTLYLKIKELLLESKIESHTYLKI